MMFDRLAARARRLAEARAAARRAALAAELAAALPPGVKAETGEEGVTLSGRGLRRRFALDAALRWLIAEKTR
jgi:ABC-type protease/lipase transport system fused ATPase/permease subunit